MSQVAVLVFRSPETAQDRLQIIQEAGRQTGLTLPQDAAMRLAAITPPDRGRIQRMMEILALYQAGGGSLDAAAVDALFETGVESSFDAVIEACVAGDAKRLGMAIRALPRGEDSPIAVLRVLLRHFRRLHEALAGMQAGQAAEQAMQALKPPVFYSQKASFARQLQHWTLTSAERALGLVTDGELQSKQGVVPADIAMERTAFLLCQLAKKGA